MAGRGGGVIEWDDLDKQRFYVIAPLASLSCRAVLYPAELVKVRLQVQGPTKAYAGVLDALVKIVRADGFRGLFRGFLPNSLGVLTSQVYVTIYEVVRLNMGLVSESEAVRNFVAGGVSSFTAQTLFVPVDLVSQRLMVQGQPGAASPSPATPLGVRDMVSSIYSTQGLRGFYKGYLASILTFVPTSAVWWTSYGKARRFQIDRGYGDSVRAQAAAGFCAGVFTAVATNPIDVVRARVQVRGRVGDGMTIGSTLGALLRESGVSGLYKGVAARMLHMGPSSVLMVSCYETVKRLSLKEQYRLPQQ